MVTRPHNARHEPPPKNQAAFDFSGTAEQEAEWETWLRENQPIWRAFVRFSLEVIASGREHFSADAVLHRVRFFTMVEEKNSDFKCNNNWTSYLAREFHRRFPQHAGFFRLRRSRADAEVGRRDA